VLFFVPLIEVLLYTIIALLYMSFNLFQGIFIFQIKLTLGKLFENFKT